MSLGESVVELLESGASFTYVAGKASWLTSLFSEFSIKDVKSNVLLIEGEKTERFVSEEPEQKFGNKDNGSRTVDSCSSSS
jgi:hypothetical protein